jgi:hypothetical protein
MLNNWFPDTAPRPLTAAMIAFVGAYALHATDNFRRGLGARLRGPTGATALDRDIAGTSHVAGGLDCVRPAAPSVPPRRIGQSLPATKSAA